DGKTRISEDFSPQLDIRTLHTNHQRDFDTQLASGIYDSLGEDITTHDAAENIDQHTAHPGIGENDLEGVGYSFFGRPTPDVEEISRLPAAEFNNIHRGHGQTGAVDHTTDVAVQGDVGELVLAGFDLPGIFLVQIAQGQNVLVPKQCVVIETHFRIQRHNLTFFGNNQRVDFRDRTIAFIEGVIQ